MRTEEEIKAELELIQPLLDQQTVIVTHTPAFGWQDLTEGGEHAGSRSLAVFLEDNPVLAHIHGHIHASFGTVGNHFNVPAARQCRAMLIELPSLKHEIVTNSDCHETSVTTV